MNGFIELRSNGKPIMVNVSHIVKVETEEKGGSVLLLSVCNYINETPTPFYCNVDESYAEVKELIKVSL